jgi:hypothetical protein
MPSLTSFETLLVLVFSRYSINISNFYAPNTTLSRITKGRRVIMASRVLLQRISGRGTLSLSPRASSSSSSVPWTLHLSKKYSSIRNNGILYNTNTNTINPTRNQKHFSTSAIRTKELATMSEEEVSGLKVKEDRLMGDLHETCEWGKGEVWGR